MSNEQKTVLVRCKCGKKFRVRTNADDAGVSCPECGQMVRLTAALPAVVTSEKHWSWNVLWMVWAVPACIAVLGAVFIIGDLVRRPDDVEQNRAQQKSSDPEAASDAGDGVAEEPALAEAEEPPPQEFAHLFPGAEITQLPNLTFRGIRSSGGTRLTNTVVDAEMQVVDGALVTGEDETTAVLLSESSEDFELKLTGNFRDHGNLYLLVGWDQESASGSLVYTVGVVQAWPWFVTRIQDGEEIGDAVNAGAHRIRSEGTLSVTVKSNRLSMDFSGVTLADAVELPDYRRGAVVLGTAPNQYHGKSVRIDSILFRGD